MRRPALAAAVFVELTWAASTRAAAPSGTDRTSYVTVNGLRMYVEKHGSGPPLVLLHGGGSTALTS